MLKGFFKVLSYIQLALGIIGSFIVAYNYYNNQRRPSIGITIGYFLVSLFSVIIFFSILYAFYRILDNQDRILYKLSYLDVPNKPNSNKDNYNNFFKSDFKLKKMDEEIKLNPGEWICTFCGKVNPKHSDVCKCGGRKPI